jgi:hypothetical protein
MKIITAYTDSYEWTVRSLSRCSRRAGYDIFPIHLHSRYEVVNEVPLASSEWKPLSPWKPSLILEELRKTDGLLAWIDADVAILRNIDEIDSGDYDFAVCARQGPVEFFRKINAGVCFFYPTEETFSFLREWIRITALMPNGSDQFALNHLLNESPTTKIFDCKIYNYCDWLEPPTADTKIVHCRTEDRSKGFHWLKSKGYLGDRDGIL